VNCFKDFCIELRLKFLTPHIPLSLSHTHKHTHTHTHTHTLALSLSLSLSLALCVCPGRHSGRIPPRLCTNARASRSNQVWHHRAEDHPSSVRPRYNRVCPHNQSRRHRSNHGTMHDSDCCDWLEQGQPSSHHPRDRACHRIRGSPPRRRVV
jgi:hypothetical protein